MFLSGIEVGQRPDNHNGIMGNNQQPWLPIEAVKFLQENLKPNFTGFEFGSGSSSFWFSKITQSLQSIESDREWSSMMESIAAEKGINNVNFKCVPCDMLPIWDLDLEKSENYEIYSNEILLSECEFDYILVDGVARSLCIEKSISKLKEGGFLIIDNAERPAYWQAMEKIPSTWKQIKFSNEVDTTLIYQKHSSVYSI